MEIPNNIQVVARYCDLKKWSAFTKKNYVCALRRFLYHYKHIKDHEHINDAMVEDYLLTIPGRSSRCTTHSVIKLWFRLKGQPNKLKYTPYPDKEDKLPIHVNQQEFIKMIQVCHNEKHRAIICLMFDCGLRVSEVINLKLNDIDASNMVINIIQSKGRKDRKVKLTTALLSIIQNYCAIYNPVNYLFSGQSNSMQYSTRSIQQVIKQLSKKADIKKQFTPHKFRHGYAMSLLENGETLDSIGHQLGHNNKKTTEIYARINNKVIQKIQSPLEQILNRQNSSTNALLGVPVQTP